MILYLGSMRYRSKFQPSEKGCTIEVNLWQLSIVWKKKNRIKYVIIHFVDLTQYRVIFLVEVNRPIETINESMEKTFE